MVDSVNEREPVPHGAAVLALMWHCVEVGRGQGSTANLPRSFGDEFSTLFDVAYHAAAEVHARVGDVNGAMAQEAASKAVAEYLAGLAHARGEGAELSV